MGAPEKRAFFHNLGHVFFIESLESRLSICIAGRDFTGRPKCAFWDPKFEGKRVRKLVVGVSNCIAARYFEKLCFGAFRIVLGSAFWD